jgi:hypothetical protein
MLTAMNRKRASWAKEEGVCTAALCRFARFFRKIALFVYPFLKIQRKGN